MNIEEDFENKSNEEDEINENSEEEYEEYDQEEFQFSLSEDEINEWINELTKLRDEKSPIELEIDEENILKIIYEEDVEENGE